MAKKSQVKYKKAPQAPRRFKSSYMFFSTEKHKSIRKELMEKENAEKVSVCFVLSFLRRRVLTACFFVLLIWNQLSTTEVAKMVSQEWKNLSSEEREKWEELARKDKARYEMEKTMYTGPWKIPAKKRSQKDPNAPKRPMSAFLSFSNSKRSQVKNKHPDIGNAEVSRILAQMWKDASDDERKDHIDKEFKLRQEYKVAIAEWRLNSENEMQAARKEREDQAMKAVLEGKPIHDQSSYNAGRFRESDDYSYQNYPPQHQANSYYPAAAMPPSSYPPPQYYPQGNYNESATSTMMQPYGSYYDRSNDSYSQHYPQATSSTAYPQQAQSYNNNGE